jgi:hydroxyacylglutathione hydrolase
MKILQFVADALGDASYLLIDGDVAAAIDPQRDVRRIRQAAAEHNTEIKYVFETHVHNDYLSGGRELAALGAQVVAPALGKLEFPHISVNEGDELQIGGARLKVIAAPGHTYEHTAYLALGPDEKVAGAFTGGSLLMGGAGRSDLLGPDHTEELTRLQFETAQRLAKLVPSMAEVLPTHGAGSFCSTTGMPDDRRGPMRDELERNAALTSGTLEVFRMVHLLSLGPIPGYYRYMAPINRSGPKVYGDPPRPTLLAPDTLVALQQAGVHVLDVRPASHYISGFIPGSIEMEESGSLLAFAGWLVPFNAPIALVSIDERQAERVTADLWGIGYEDVRGFLPYERWVAEGRETATLPTASLEEAAEALVTQSVPVLDVRFSNEHHDLPLPGAIERPVNQLPDWADSVDDEPHLVICESGQRSAMAASILAAKGKPVTAVIGGGASAVLRMMKGKAAAS